MLRVTKLINSLRPHLSQCKPYLQEFNVAIFGDYRHVGGRGRVVHEINVDNADCGWDSDEEGQEDEVRDDAENCGILNNTVFNWVD